MIKSMLIAGVGGFVGTCCRYLVGRWSATWFEGMFPMATFLVNIAGCFLIGLIFGLIEKHQIVNPATGLLLITGFCGGFTTFSAFANEIWSLGNRGQWLISIAYLAASIIIGILLVCGGRHLALKF